MENLIVLFLAPNTKTVVDRIIYLAAKNDCLVEESRLITLGGEIGGMMRLGGNWNALAKTEDALQKLKSRLHWWLEVKRCLPAKTNSDHLPYLVQTVGINKPTVINEVMHFFTEQQVHITDLQTDSYKTNFADTRMLMLIVRLQIPANINIAELRERFMLLCEELNIDGILEPEKGIK